MLKILKWVLQIGLILFLIGFVAIHGLAASWNYVLGFAKWFAAESQRLIPPPKSGPLAHHS